MQRIGRKANGGRGEIHWLKLRIGDRLRRFLNGGLRIGGRIVTDRLDLFAQKAGEAFVAAGWAQTSEHRATAQGYQEIISGLRKRRRKPKSSDNENPNENRS